MDRKKCKTLLKSGVLEAWAEGKPIQILSNDGLSWRDIDRDAMLFESSNAYRVKPEPVTVKVKAREHRIMSSQYIMFVDEQDFPLDEVTRVTLHRD